MKSAPPEFLSWFKSQLISRNLGVRDAARVIKVSHPTISDIVTHGQQPSFDVTKKIAHAFDVDEHETLVLAGHVSGKLGSDEYDEEGGFLLRTLKPALKKIAIKQLKALHEQQDEDADGLQNPATQPR